jgi:serine/threonine-protein kinase
VSGNGDVPDIIAGRYIIERELGRGGTAIVYLAHDRSANRPVALKLLREELVASFAANRFLKEIRLSQGLNHPHVVQVLDSGEHDERPYLVLPVMEEGSLRDRLKRESQLPTEAVVAITQTIASALTYAHGQGLIHRDVKPENILFSGGKACLSDFGIARAFERAIEDTASSTSFIIGTAAYMSPEQSTGNKAIDARTDIYSLACVTYEMLSGMQAYVGPNNESLLAQKVLHRPRAVHVYRPSVSRAVDTVLAKALEVTPADRYGTAMEFADAFARAVAAPQDASDARVRWRRIAVGAAIVAAAFASAIPLARRVASTDGAVGSVPEGDPRRVAVLYFDVGSPTTLPTYVADGITESVIDALSSVRALHVLSPTAVRRFRGAPFSHDSVRQALKAGTIVSGSVARSGDVVRVNVRLTDAASGQQLSNESVSTGWTELFALEEKVADRVAFALRQRIGAEIDLRERRRGTTSLAAWNAAQQADEVMRRLQGDLPPPSAARGEMLRSWWRQADSLYIVALALDRGWSYPVVRRGQMALRLWIVDDPPLSWQDTVPPGTMSAADKKLHWLRRAVDLASEALRIDSKSSDALALRGEARYTLMSGRPGHDTLAGLIDRDLQAAVSLRPENASAWRTRALFLSGQARFAEAVAAADRAFQSDPFLQQSSVIATAFWAALWAEHFEDARKWCRLGRDHYPRYPALILFAECDLTLLGWTGSGRDVARSWQMVDSIEHVPSPVAQSMLRSTWGYRRLLVAAILARAGMGDSARAVLRRVQATAPAERGLTTTPEAHVYALLGERDSAVARLGELLRAAPQRRTFFLGLPWAKSLRDDPRLASGVGSSTISRPSP